MNKTYSRVRSTSARLFKVDRFGRNKTSLKSNFNSYSIRGIFLKNDVVINFINSEITENLFGSNNNEILERWWYSPVLLPPSDS